jgi:hypothetical protein
MDDLNREIWNQPIPENLRSHVFEETVAGPRAKFVPDVLATRKSTKVLFMGLAYGLYLHEDFEVAKAGMPFSSYQSFCQNNDYDGFQACFRQRVFDRWAYYKTLLSWVPCDCHEAVAFTDLCRATVFVRDRNGKPSIKSSALRKIPDILSYLAGLNTSEESSRYRRWTIERINICQPDVVVTLGTDAESGLLRALTMENYQIAASDLATTYDSSVPQWLNTYAGRKDRRPVKLCDWISIPRVPKHWLATKKGLGSQIRIFPAYHPSRCPPRWRSKDLQRAMNDVIGYFLQNL